MSSYVKWSESQSCLTLWDPMDCSPPGSSAHGILQVRILEWVAISSSRGSSQPRDQTQVSCIASRFLYHLSHFVSWGDLAGSRPLPLVQRGCSLLVHNWPLASPFPPPPTLLLPPPPMHPPFHVSPAFFFLGSHFHFGGTHSAAVSWERAFEVNFLRLCLCENNSVLLDWQLGYT